MCDAFPVVVAAGWLLPTIPGCRRRPGPMTVRGACFVSTTILPMSFDRGYTLPAATVLAIVDRTVKFIEIRLGVRSEEHTSELQSLMRISYAVFCLKTKKDNKTRQQDNNR